MSNQSILDWTAALVPLDIPYHYGAGGLPTPLDALRQVGVDCSAIVEQIVHAATGADPGRDTVAQLASPLGQVIPDLTQALPGDEIYFGSAAGGPSAHVGIFLGGNQIADAPHTGTTFGIHTFSPGGYGSEPILGIRRFAGSGGTPAPASFGASPVAYQTQQASLLSDVTGSLGKVAVEVVLVGGAAALLAFSVFRVSQRSTAKQ
jgi:hypothetical protein